MATHGRLLAEQTVAEPLWDSAAVAQGRLHYASEMAMDAVIVKRLDADKRRR